MPDVAHPVKVLVACALCGATSFMTILYARESMSVADAQVFRVKLPYGWVFVQRFRCDRHA